MRRLAAIIFISLFCCGFTRWKSPRNALTKPADKQQQSIEYDDSLAPLYAYTDAIRLIYADGDTIAGRQALLRAVNCDTAYAPALYMLGVDAEMRDPDAAENYARRAYRADTSNRWYARQYARALILNERYAEALPIYEKLLRDDPAEPDNYRMLALLYQQHNQPFSALVILDSAEVRFGRLPGLSHIKRSLLLGTRQYDKALAEAEALAAEAPYDITAHLALGEMYAAAGRDSLALASFRRAAEYDSTNIEVLMALSDFYNHRRDERRYLAVAAQIFRNDDMPTDDKLRIWSRLSSDVAFYGRNYLQMEGLIRSLMLKYPDNDDVAEAYAMHLLASGERDEALEMFKRRTAERPDVKANYEMVIRLESYLFERPDSAARYIDAALRRFPDDFDLYMHGGSANSLTGRYDESERCFRRALKLADSDSLRSVVHGYLGDLCQAQANARVNPDGEEHVPDLFRRINADAGARRLMKRCFDEYEKALKADPDNASVLNNYSYFLSEQDKDVERAVEMGRRATEVARNVSTYLDTYAWALHKAGRDAEAKRIMQQALSLDTGNSAELQMHYGDILSALGERFMAEIYWRRALENGYPADAVLERFEKQKEAKDSKTSKESKESKDSKTSKDSQEQRQKPPRTNK